MGSNPVAPTTKKRLGHWSSLLFVMPKLLVDAYLGTPEVVDCRLGLKFEDDRGEKRIGEG